MSLWRRVLQGMTAFSVDTVVSNLAAVASAALVFRYLEVHAYGQLALALSFYATGSIFLGMGLGAVFTAEIARARGTGERGWVKFLISCYSMLLLGTATATLCIFVGIGMGQGESELWTIMGVYLWLTAPNSAVHALLHGATRYRRLAGQSMTRSLSRLALLAMLPWWWSGELLVGVALTYPLMELTTLAVSLYLARVAWRDFRRASARVYGCKDLLYLFTQRGIYATLDIPVAKLSAQLPVWFLKALMGDGAVGIYGAAEKGFSLFYAFFSALERTIFPLVAEQIEVDKERLQIALRQVQKYAFWLGLVVVVVGGSAAHWFVQVVAGETYLGAVPLFRLRLCSLLIYAFSQSHRPLYYALGQQKWLFAIRMGSMLLHALLLIAGITVLGVIGAVWAYLIQSMSTALTRLMILRWLSPEFWVNPLSVFRIEAFDRRLWRILKF